MQQYYDSPTIHGLKGESYMWEPNGSGGVNYYKVLDNGASSSGRVPVSREVFASNTGADVGQIESYVQANTGNGGYSTNADAPPDSGLGGGTSGGGGGGTPAPSQLFSYGGVQYNGANPQDMQRYYGVRSGEIDKQLQDALTQGQFDQAKQLIDYKAQWDQQGKDLLAGYGQGVTSRQQYFQGLGGRAYQSSMGSSGQYALNQLGEAQTKRNTDLASNNTAMDRAYNDFVNQNTQKAVTAKDALVNSQPGMDSNPTLAGYTPQQATPTDISQYTPYTNFSQLAASPMAQPAATSGVTLAEKLKQLKDPNGFSLADYILGKGTV
jgi:hypothetical protein